MLYYRLSNVTPEKKDAISADLNRSGLFLEDADYPDVEIVGTKNTEIPEKHSQGPADRSILLIPEGSRKEYLETASSKQFDGLLEYPFNVHELKMTAASLEKVKNNCREYHRKVFENINVAIFIVDVIEKNGDRVFRYVANNPLHDSLFHHNQPFLAGKKPEDLEDLYGKQAVEYILRIYNECVDSRKTHESEYELEQGGAKQWWQTTLQPVIENGNVTRLIGSAFDITTGKMYQQEQARLRRNLESIWNLSEKVDLSPKDLSDLILQEIVRITDSIYGFYGFVNDDEDMFTIHSWSRETMSDCGIIHKPIEYDIEKAGIWGDAVRTRKPVIVNDYLAAVGKKGLPQGHVAISRLISVPVIHQGKIIALGAVANKETDYTDDDVKQIYTYMERAQSIIWRNKATAEFKEALAKAEESDRLKSAFLANLSHEIRTPMNGILGFTSLLKNRRTSAGQREKFLEMIESSSRRLLLTMEDLIDLACIESLQTRLNLADCDLLNLFYDLFDKYSDVLTQEGISLSISSKMNTKARTIHTDVGKLRRVLEHLIDNAIKFSNGDTIEIGFREKNKKVEITVKDNGIGMKPEEIPKVFQSFTKLSNGNNTPYEGMGIGLSLVKSFAETIRAEIAIESELDRGTVIHIFLPYSIGDSSRDKIPPESTQIINKTSGRILLAEDDMVNKIYITNVLKSLDLEYILVENGQDAVESVRRYKDIKVVLMDLKMPVMDGYEAFEIIQREFPNLIVIAQTAYASRNDIIAINEAGFDNYLSKPYKKEQLEKMLSLYLNDI